MIKCEYEKQEECNKKCRYWIDYPQEKNCCLYSIEKNGPMSLREVADRLKISYVRVKQIEDELLAKIKNSF